VNEFNGVSFGEASPAVDLTEIFFTQKGGKAYLNARVVDLSMTITEPWVSHWYIFTFKAGGDAVRRIDAIVDQRGTPIFTYGTDRPDVTDPSPSYEGNTTGTFHEGPNGVIEIEIPVEAMGLAGKKLTALTGQTRVGTRPAQVVPAPVGIRYVAPIADDANGKGTFEPTGTCVPEGGAPVAPGTDVPVGTPAAPQPAAPAPQPAKKPAAKKQPSCAAKAKKIKNKKKRAAALKRCKKAAKKK
jgi:hypothetical protein